MQSDEHANAVFRLSRDAVMAIPITNPSLLCYLRYFIPFDEKKYRFLLVPWQIAT
jgi:hypothetical protein